MTTPMPQIINPHILKRSQLLIPLARLSANFWWNITTRPPAMRTRRPKKNALKLNSYILLHYTLVRTKNIRYNEGSLGRCGGIAQLARAPALQAGGPGFESLCLHHYGVKWASVHDTPPGLIGCLAQLARASRLHREGRGFESLSAHHQLYVWAISSAGQSASLIMTRSEVQVPHRPPEEYPVIDRFFLCLTIAR